MQMQHNVLTALLSVSQAHAKQQREADVEEWYSIKNYAALS